MTAGTRRPGRPTEPVDAPHGLGTGQAATSQAGSDLNDLGRRAQVLEVLAGKPGRCLTVAEVAKAAKLPRKETGKHLAGLAAKGEASEHAHDDGSVVWTAILD